MLNTRLVSVWYFCGMSYFSIEIIFYKQLVNKYVRWQITLAVIATIYPTICVIRSRMCFLECLQCNLPVRPPCRNFGIMGHKQNCSMCFLGNL